MKIALDILSDNAVFADASDTVSSLIGKFKTSKFSEACVFDKKQFKGIFSHFTFLRSRLNSSNIRIDNFTISTSHVQEEDNLTKIAILMFNNNSIILPVFRNNSFLGIVDIFSVFQNIREIQSIRVKKLADLLHDIVSIRENETLGKALHLMHLYHIRELPTVDENGNPSGIIKSVDLLEQYYLSPYEREYGQRPKTQTRAFKADPASSLNVPAKNFISKVPLIVDRNEDLYSVVEKMGQTKTLTVMVFSGKGYKEITSKDILKLIMDTSIPEVQNIRFVGLNKLDIEPSMKDTIKRVCSMHAQKFQFYIKNIFDVVVHIKEYSKTGRKHNFLIHVRLNYPGGTLSSHNRNWNLLTGVQLAFTEVENLIRHKFKRNVKEIVPAKRFFEEDGTGTEVEEA